MLPVLKIKVSSHENEIIGSIHYSIDNGTLNGELEATKLNAGTLVVLRFDPKGSAKNVTRVVSATAGDNGDVKLSLQVPDLDAAQTTELVSCVRLPGTHKCAENQRVTVYSQ